VRRLDQNELKAPLRGHGTFLAQSCCNAAMSAQYPVCPKADTAGRFMSTRPSCTHRRPIEPISARPRHCTAFSPGRDSSRDGRVPCLRMSVDVRRSRRRVTIPSASVSKFEGSPTLRPTPKRPGRTNPVRIPTCERARCRTAPT
jgi:hypothetical protein